MRLAPIVGVVVLGFALGVGCSSDDDDGAGSPGGSSGNQGTGGAPGSGGSAATGGSTGSGGSSGSGATGSGTRCTTNADCTAPEQCVAGGCGPVLIQTCQGKDYECGNGLDDDNDGLTDMNDRDCLGPCSNSESIFHNCIPGGGQSACTEDCYFDQDSGSGNDTCEWSHTCDPLGVNGPERGACPYLCEADGCTGTSEECVQTCTRSPTATPRQCSDMYMTQPDTCMSFCGPLTPNGCDCFGCCDVLGDGDYRYMGSTSDDTGDCTTATCTLDAAIAKDDEACKKCLPVAACLNTCGRCECCLGKDCNNLPADCAPPADAGPPGCVPPQCGAGVQPCGVADCTDPCPATHYCLTGCCIETPR